MYVTNKKKTQFLTDIFFPPEMFVSLTRQSKSPDPSETEPPYFAIPCGVVSLVTHFSIVFAFHFLVFFNVFLFSLYFFNTIFWSQCISTLLFKPTSTWRCRTDFNVWIFLSRIDSNLKPGFVDFDFKHNFYTQIYLSTRNKPIFKHKLLHGKYDLEVVLVSLSNKKESISKSKHHYLTQFSHSHFSTTKTSIWLKTRRNIYIFFFCRRLFNF